MALDLAVIVSGTGVLVAAAAVVTIATAQRHPSSTPQKATFSWVDGPPGGSSPATPSPAHRDLP